MSDDMTTTDGHGMRVISTPDQHGTLELIEFDSMINVRPRQGNRSRSVEDPAAREAIIRVVGRLIAP